MKTDAELVQLTLADQVSAFETLVRRWSARVFAYTLSRVCRRQIAEEVTQETFLRAFRSLKTLQTPEKFGSWLLSIAHRQAIDWLKAKSQTEIGFDDLESVDGNFAATVVDPGDRSPSLPIEVFETTNDLFEQVQQLPEDLREVLMMYYFDQVTYQQVAEMLEISVATVNDRLARARSILRQRLSCEDLR